MLQSLHYSIDIIRDEARQLVQQGLVGRQQPIYTLCRHIPAREWAVVETELESSGFCWRDRVADLMGREDWEND
ncbi:MAG: DUF4327 family protein [Leptolyngbyaceae cyanobacterium SM2_5_2]|nr:DUF4327 family protein [Leptolyngbyaceae cyanobacterium SM2_5_2]